MIVIEVPRAEAELLVLVLEDFVQYLKQATDTDPDAMKQAKALLKTVRASLGEGA